MAKQNIKRISVDLTQKEYKALCNHALKKGISHRETMRKALEIYLRMSR